MLTHNNHQITFNAIFPYKDTVRRFVRKAVFCICEIKDADQVRGDREADQRLCFRCTEGTMPLLLKSEILSL